MTFYVIGNGFDLHYGLNTTYYHFKKYLLKNGHRDLVKKVDQLIYERSWFTPDEIDTWSQFEDMLTVFNRLDAEEIYGEAMSNAETDDDRAGYWDSPAWNVGYYNQYIHVLKQEFDSWIRSFDTYINTDHYFDPQYNDFILTFNYTTTIEDNFHINRDNILHLHGTIGQELVLGHNDYQAPDKFVVIEDEDSDYRDTSTRNAVNDVLELASIQYFKNSEEILNKYKNVFSQIPRYDKVVFMGSSCGLQDSIYIEEILKYAKNIDFYYHGTSAKSNFEYYASRYPVNVNYISWQQLHKTAPLLFIAE